MFAELRAVVRRSIGLLRFALVAPPKAVSEAAQFRVFRSLPMPVWRRQHKHRFVSTSTSRFVSSVPLADPYRVVVDIRRSASGYCRRWRRGGGLIKAFRYGMVLPGGSRSCSI